VERRRWKREVRAGAAGGGEGERREEKIAMLGGDGVALVVDVENEFKLETLKIKD
jgi:hypothetical protein